MSLHTRCVKFRRLFYALKMFFWTHLYLMLSFFVVFFTAGFFEYKFSAKTQHTECVYMLHDKFRCEKLGVSCCFFAFYTLLIIFAVFKMCKEKREPNQTFKTSSNVRKLMPLGEESECTTSQS